METTRIHRPMFTLIGVNSTIATMILSPVRTVQRVCVVCTGFLFASFAVGCSNHVNGYGQEIEGDE